MTAGVQEEYACKCGFHHPDRKIFNTHLLRGGKVDGKGVHKSLGIVDAESGELVKPPWDLRSPQERVESMFPESMESIESEGKSEETGDVNKSSAKSATKEKKTLTTQAIAEATSIRVIPRVFQMDYTPIMRMAQDAAINLWRWRPNMPFENFIDTCLYNYFLEHGITLCGYVVDPKVLEELSASQSEDNNGATAE